MRWLLFILALLACTGCREQRQQLGQALSGRPPVIAGTLAGTWQLVDLNGGGTVAGGAMQFSSDGQLSGSAGCNRFGGRWQQAATSLQLGPLVATRMACAAAVMDVEQRVLALLGAVRSVSFSAAGEAVLATPDGRTLRLARPPEV